MIKHRAEQVVAVLLAFCLFLWFFWATLCSIQDARRKQKTNDLQTSFDFGRDEDDGRLGSTK